MIFINLELNFFFLFIKRYINENIIERYKPSLLEDDCNNIEIKLGRTKIE
jgi:hypothetical protein